MDSFLDMDSFCQNFHILSRFAIFQKNVHIKSENYLILVWMSEKILHKIFKDFGFLTLKKSRKKEN